MIWQGIIGYLYCKAILAMAFAVIAGRPKKALQFHRSFFDQQA